MRQILLCAAVILFATGCSKQINPVQPAVAEMAETLAVDSLELPKLKPKPYSPSEKIVNDITHTKLELSFNYDKKEVYGKATLTVKPFFHPVKELVLDARGFTINRIAVLKGDQMKPINFKNDSITLTIQLDKEYTSDETYQVFIDYVARPYDIIDADTFQGIYFEEVKNEGQLDSYQVYTQGETELSASWFPTHDTPNEKFTQEIYLTVEKQFKTLSNGLLLNSVDNGDGTKTDYWKQSLPHATYLVLIAFGDYSIVKDTWRGIEVSYYVEPSYEQHARAMFGKTPKMIEFYSNLLGYDYPWEKYSQIICRGKGISGAMENTTAVTYNYGFQLTARELLDEEIESTVSHELFHHWFGDLVTAESWPNLTLNEGFATYGEYLWDEFEYGVDFADYNLDWYLDNYLNNASDLKHDLVWFDTPHRNEMFDAHSYAKGGRILHMLRNYLGDKVFFTSISNYLNQHEYQSVEAHNLRLSFEKTSGEDLNWFFNQWFFGKGHPELKITYEYDEVAKKQHVIIDQLQDLNENGLYKLPIQIDLYRNGKVDTFDVVINNAHEKFSFDAPTKPNLVNVDADKMLVCVKEDVKTKEELIFQFTNAPLFVDKKEAFDGLLESYEKDIEAQAVFKKALNDPFYAIRIWGLEYLNDSILNYPEDLKNRLIDLANNEEKSEARVAALAHLNSFYDDKSMLIPIYEKAINDSSYAVINHGLEYLYGIDQELGRKHTAKFEGKNNQEIHPLIAKLYSENGMVTDNAFYIAAINSNGGYYKRMILSSYTNYLINQKNDSLIALGLPILKTNATDPDIANLRYTALAGLKKLQWYYEDQLEAESIPEDDKQAVLKLKNNIETDLNKFLQDEKNERVKKRFAKMVEKNNKG
ncbi:MAG: M1 family metallopeptidase [Flavobacteriales bacterium]|nr:M1 family metallopeptidase [Flavobacteriales bacterium]